MSAPKVIIAVHGIGDQSRNATVQSVATRFADHCGSDLRLPLGHFYASDQATVVCHQLIPPGPQPAHLANVWFAEVYWAPIARKAADDKHTLEETKAWARTIVSRLRGHTPDQRHAVAVVLEEIIETVDVLEHLLLLGRLAGLFDFELKGLLDDYLGDVQQVTEFAGIRETIIEEFRHILTAVAQGFPSAEIHLITHSEGTVVGFYALLEALHGGRPWVDQVRGWMTIGSPIDKHLFMWPWMWAPFENRSPAKRAASIRWRNYYDYGDPIGFKLEEARSWLSQHDRNGCFDFKEADDIGFARYWIPGKAHNDYWDDADVFGDFIKDVVQIPITPDRKIPKLQWTKPFVYLFSPIIPYVLAFLLLYAGTLLLVRATENYRTASTHQPEAKK